MSGLSFSDIVKKAISLGMTEPNVSNDLSGKDSIAKCIVLWRLIGGVGTPPETSVDSLVPTDWNGCVDLNSQGMRDISDRLEQKALEAQKNGSMLRYSAVVRRESIQMSVISVPTTSPLVSFRDGNSGVVIYSRWAVNGPLFRPRNQRLSCQTDCLMLS